MALKLQSGIDHFSDEDKDILIEVCEFLELTLDNYAHSVLDGFLDGELDLDRNCREEALEKLDGFPEFLDSNYSQEVADYFQTVGFGAIDYQRGAFKVVFFLENMPYVIKLAIHYLGDGSTESRQIKNEVSIFNDAIAANIDKFFAASYYLGEVIINKSIGFSIGIQEKVDSLGSKAIGTEDIEENCLACEEILKKAGIIADNLSERYSEEVSSYYYNEIVDDYAPYAFWFNELYQYCGVDTFGDIINFLDAHDLCDFHPKNVGYRNGIPVFLDYSPI